MDLLPCPFCGSADVEMVTRYELFVVECQDCGAVGQDRAKEHYAAAAWKRRAANAPADPALMALARFGADVIASHRGPTGKWAQPALLALPDIARDIGVTIGGQFAPGIASAIAALLAPDGAASEGVDRG